MIVFFFSVALTNLALGYALALYLHPELVSSESPAVDPQPSRAEAPVAGAIAKVEFASRPSEPQASADEVIESHLEAAALGDNSSGDSPAPQQPEVTIAVAPAEPSAPIMTEAVEPESQSAIASSPVEPVAPAPAHSAVVDDQHAADETGDIVGCIERLASGLEAYQSQLQKIEERVQDCVERPDAGAVQGCLRDLRTMNYDYFEKQLETSAQLAKVADESNTTIATSIDLAVTTQSACISDVDCALIELDPATDSLASANQLLAEVTKLLGGCDRFTLALKPNDEEVEPAPQAAAQVATAMAPSAADGATA